ncbi:Malonyl CoA-acyl carrier protein transacylase [hydrothermal vent metagenome]|uniref:[acyl-carrier-protein] S-malonyltransferase n=1 Tax=hydrothermal vent metagenome TaxID=652676 RepID=A0A3B1C5M1_9ZZZZ
MNKIALLFPGQGAQFVGMADSLVSTGPKAVRRVEEANDILGFDLGKLISEGPEQQLQLTANTQPAIALVSIIALEALKERVDINPLAAAGHSLGEFSACWAACAIEFADVIKLVRRRGELMQSAVPVGEGAMAAIIGLDAETVGEICLQAGGMVRPANFNSPEQTVIAGKTGDVSKAMELAKTGGAKKVVALAVSAPFHTPLMAPAQDGLREFMKSITFKDPVFPIIRNVDSGLSKTASDLKDGLIRQVTGCVRWVDSMKKLAEMGTAHALEIGPGRTLGGLMKRIDRSIKVTQSGTAEGIEKTANILSGQI